MPVVNCFVSIIILALPFASQHFIIFKGGIDLEES